ncbi:hypothetical protein ACI2IY_00625 [Lysobacter enzymogenes]|uniref:hypothetical protein n=1 Tax=Lysobacter enzymogenes TaxID=69 RepID=UPI00384A7277
MRVFVRVTEFNPVLLVCDSGALGLPALTGKGPLQVSDTCIAVRNASANGLTTRLLVTDELVARPGDLICRQVIRTPNRAVVVCSVLLEVYAAVVTRRTRSLVRVFTNDPVTPDRVVVVVGEQEQPG